MSTARPPSEPIFPAEIELRVFNFLLHDDYRRSAATFLRLSRGHFTEFTPRSCHTVIVTDTNIRKLTGLFEGGATRPYNTYVKRVVFARACAEEATHDLPSKTWDPLLPFLQSVVISRQYFFESILYTRDYVRRQAWHDHPVLSTLVYGHGGISVCLDMDVPIHREWFDNYRRKTRAIMPPEQWLWERFKRFWEPEHEEGTDLSNMLEDIFRLLPVHRKHKGTIASPTPLQLCTIRNIPRIDDCFPDELMQHERPRGGVRRVMLQFGNSLPGFMESVCGSPAFHRPGKASEQLCCALAEVLQGRCQTEIWIQNADIDDTVINENYDKTSCYFPEDLRRKDIMQRLEKVRQVGPGDTLPCPCDFDHIGGSVVCRNWETLDYTSWDDEKAEMELQKRDEEREEESDEDGDEESDEDGDEESSELL